MKFDILIHGVGWKDLFEGVKRGDLEKKNIGVTDIWGGYFFGFVDDGGKFFRYENDDFGKPIRDRINPVGYGVIQEWTSVYSGRKNPVEYINRNNSGFMKIN